MTLDALPVAPERTPPDRSQQAPSLFAASLYLIIGIATVLLSAWLSGEGLSRYAHGIAAEALLAVLALGFIAAERLSPRVVLRLRSPRWETLVAAPVLAPALWLLSVVINLITSLVLGYTTPTLPSALPTSVREALLLAFITVVVAPVCEEVMFRGYIQRALEAKAPWIGIFVGGAIFAVYHLRFQGLAALLPVSVTLGLVAWRTDSLWPGVLLHSLFNGISTLVVLSAGLAPTMVTGALMLALLAMSVVMVIPAGGALLGLWKLLPSPAALRSVAPRGVLRWVWLLPAAVIAGVYGVVSVAEIRVGALPEHRPAAELELQAPSGWLEPGSWTYAIKTRAGQPVGATTCVQTLTDVTVQLECASELDVASPALSFPWSVLRGGAQSLEQWEGRATWARDTLHLETVSATRSISDVTTTVMIGPGTQLGTLTAVIGDSATEVLLSDEGLAQHEWSWRMAALPFRIGYAVRTELLVVDRDRGLERVDAWLVVRGGEPVWTPDHTYAAWKVTLSYTDGAGISRTSTAWYDSAQPHRLLRYTDGALQYVLLD